MSAARDAARARVRGAPRRAGAPKPSTRLRWPGGESGEGRDTIPRPEVVPIGGLPIARLSGGQVVDHVFDSLRRGLGGWLVTANVDFVQRSQSRPEIRALYEQADLVVADGAPLVWASALAGARVPERVAGSDLVWSLAERAAAEGRSLYLLGGQGDAGERAALRLRARWPELHIAGVSSPSLSLPPTEEELAPVVEDAVRAAPDLVYSALGSPKQEFVIRALRAELPRSWMMGCGISLSFVAGDIPRAPVWMQRSGLEWVHRLCLEPRRLASRYLLHNLPFTLRLLYQSLRAEA